MVELTTKGIEEKIIHILSSSLLSTTQLSKEVGLRRDILAGYLEALKNQGKLEFHRIGKANVYTVVKGVKK
jgi:predicted transcriptional regulator